MIACRVSAAQTSNPVMDDSISYRTLGRTGEKVSCIGMGGYHLGRPGISEAEAIKLIHAGIDRGINFLDNSWDYNNGDSEKRMGKALKESGYRQRAFLMTKIDGRTKAGAAKQIDESLKRLQVDTLICFSFTRSFASMTRIASSTTRARLKPWWQLRRRGKPASSVSQATRIRIFICTCSKWAINMDFSSTLCRCPST